MLSIPFWPGLTSSGCVSKCRCWMSLDFAGQPARVADVDAEAVAVSSMRAANAHSAARTIVWTGRTGAWDMGPSEGGTGGATLSETRDDCHRVRGYTAPLARM